MLQKSTYVIVLVLILIIGTAAVLSSSKPPQGYTGVPGGFGTCANAGCHASFGLNSGGGNVSVSGLPAVYSNSVTYNFSLTINHVATDPAKWGFSITAKNSLGATIGTWISANPNASPTLDGTELSHLNAPSTTGAQTSYTFGNLSWTAPPTAMGVVTFYYAAVSANSDLGTLGDYVYTGTTMSSPLPITLYSFNAAIKNNNVILSWQTSQEINSDHFTVQKSNDNRQFDDIGKIDASGNSSIAKNYSFTDDNPSFFEKPIYYRIAMVDKDGAKIYSKITNVVLKATSTFIKGIYPNPLRAGSILHVNFVSKDDEIVFVKLIDNAGRLVKSNQIGVQKGSNILDVKMPQSSTGNYKLIIKSGAGLMHEPVMIR